MASNNDTIRLTKPDIFSFNECLHFLDRGYDDCLYTIENKAVFKPLRMDGKKGLIKVSPESKELKVELISGKLNMTNAAGYVREWFDLDRNLQSFYRLLRQDNRFSDMVNEFHGLRLMGIPDLFEALCWCVIGQQINLAFAYRLKRRLVETYGSLLAHNGRKHYFFPEPETLSTLKISDLKELQFSRQKAEYIIGIAADFSRGKLSKQAIADCADTGQMLEKLKQIRGVGDWTANYALMKSLGRTDCITYGDTGLQSAVATLLELDRKPSREEIKSFFEPLAGWESYLNIYLWRTLS